MDLSVEAVLDLTVVASMELFWPSSILDDVFTDDDKNGAGVEQDNDDDGDDNDVDDDVDDDIIDPVVDEMDSLVFSFSFSCFSSF